MVDDLRSEDDGRSRRLPARRSFGIVGNASARSRARTE